VARPPCSWHAPRPRTVQERVAWTGRASAVPGAGPDAGLPHAGSWRRLDGALGHPAISTPPESADAWTPKHAGWVTDLGELLSPDEERQLAGIRQAYRDETGHELALLTVPGLRGQAIETFSLRVARSWGLGRAGIDDGLLVTIDAGEHRMRIEVGDGLTDVVSDALAAEVIERDFVPAFRRADWVGGLDAGLRALMDAGRAAR